ncbi:hypothetical protein Q3H58_000328 [Pseudomonas psychrotolerans]|nr:hypothetical protein [Pseudomonas psychrotolerans]
MDDGHPALGQLAWSGAKQRLARQEQVAGIGGHQAAEHLDQGRLAGAVLADQAVDLAGPQGQVDASQRLGRPVALGDAD